LECELNLAAKWLELLKEIAPSVARAAVLRDPAVGSGTGQYAIIQAVAQSLGVELRPMDVRDLVRELIGNDRGSFLPHISLMLRLAKWSVRDRGTTDTARDARATRMTSSPMRFCHRAGDKRCGYQSA